MTHDHSYMRTFKAKKNKQSLLLVDFIRKMWVRPLQSTVAAEQRFRPSVFSPKTRKTKKTQVWPMCYFRWKDVILSSFAFRKKSSSLFDMFIIHRAFLWFVRMLEIFQEERARPASALAYFVLYTLLSGGRAGCDCDLKFILIKTPSMILYISDKPCSTLAT